MSEAIEWEYQSEDSTRIQQLRTHLHQRFKQGWKLYMIEGTVLHFRRRSAVEQAA